jgi:hypothetical protein
LDEGVPLRSSPLLSMCLPSLHLTFPCGSPKGCVGAKVKLHRCTPSCCGNSGSDLNRSTSVISAGSERLEEVIIHRMCTKPARCCTCGTKSLRWCCRTGLVASRSTRPRGRLRWLHQQCLCGSVIPAFGLQG